MLKKLNNNRLKIVILICTFILSCGTIAYADYDAFKNGSENPGSMTKTVLGWIEDIMGTETLESVNSMVAVETNFEQDTMEIGGITLSGISVGVKEINGLMIIAATMIAVICFLIGLERKFIHQPYTPEILVKQFIILGIALVCIGKSLWLCQQISNFGSGMATAVIEKISQTTNNSSAVDHIKALIYADCEAKVSGGMIKKISIIFGNISSQMGYIVQLLIPWVIMKVVSVVISFICWGRAIEILILATLSPIAFADILSERGQAAGEKFIRNFIALSLQGVVIILVMYFCSQIHLGIITNSFSSSMSVATFSKDVYKIIVIGLVEVGMCTKSLSITKEVVGLA